MIVTDYIYMFCSPLARKMQPLDDVNRHGAPSVDTLLHDVSEVWRADNSTLLSHEQAAQDHTDRACKPLAENDKGVAPSSKKVCHSPADIKPMRVPHQLCHASCRPNH